MKAFLIVLLCLLLCVPVIAQSATEETLTQCKTEAQAWYDAIDGKYLSDTDGVIWDPASLMSQRYDAINAIQVFKVKVAAIDFPPCIKVARQWYLDAMDDIASEWKDILDGTSHRVNLYGVEFRSMQLIGEMRGYLKALGVVIDERADVGSFSK